MVGVVVVDDAGWKIESGRGVIVANFNFLLEGKKNMSLTCVNVGRKEVSLKNEIISKIEIGESFFSF